MADDEDLDKLDHREHSVEPEAADPTDAPETDPTPLRGRAKRVAVIGARLVTGTVGTASALAIIGIVGFVPLPHFGSTPAGATIVPDPADQLRVCAGAALRLGDESGQNADIPQTIGVPAVRSGSDNARLRSAVLPNSDATSARSAAAPTVLLLEPATGTALAGAQSQGVNAPDYVGFTAASCAEPSSSIWLTGGATTVGRTSLLTLDNPTKVAATVRLTILGESGEVVAPGMAGIDVQPGMQRVLSVAGFAPGLASPVIHVEARGGQVTAFLQQSIVRGLDATGVDVVDAGASPGTQQTIPGIRLRNAVAVSRAQALADWDDAVSAIRIGVPGQADATVTVSVTSSDPTIEGSSFVAKVSAGTVDELPLDSGSHTETAAVAHPDGLYTVTVTSDVPVVAGVRATTAVDSGISADEEQAAAPASDFAWYSSVAPLDGDTLFTVAPGPDPKLAVTNPTNHDLTVVLTSLDGDETNIAVAAGATASSPVRTGESYVLKGATDAVAAVSYAGDAQLAAYPITSPRPFSAPLVVRP